MPHLQIVLMGQEGVNEAFARSRVQTFLQFGNDPFTVLDLCL